MTERTCGKCGAALPMGAKFCMECGSELQPVCAKCGAALPAGAKFCMECGTPAGTAPAENKDAKPAGSAPNAPTRQEEAKKPVANEPQMSGISERGLFSTIRELGWKEKGARDIIFSIIDRGDAAAMEALMKSERSKISYTTLEYVKTGGDDGIPYAYLSLPPLHAAIITGNLKITAELIKNGADVNKTIEEDPDRKVGSTPLHLACRYFSPKIIFLLLDSGALCYIPRNDGNTPLHLAAANDKNGAVVRRLINAGSDVNAKMNDGSTPLHYASQNGHYDNFITLVNAGADVKVKTNEGSTLLHSASQNGHTDIVTALINIGADVNAKNKWGRTPLHLASNNGHTDVAIALINAGAKLNMIDYEEKTPLHEASFRRRTDIAIALINAGANVNAKNKIGEMPLHLASMANSTDIPVALINAGADINAEVYDETGHTYTPLNYALANNATEVAKILRAAGAVSRR
ncbi:MULTISPECIES: ankyrin repeat domain-containing protein [Synergistaceae]|uniref:ankyrin repeat domain-containing protein n=1 Tax=Synergistaceae TaxID=649777 RepID=UPI003AE1F06A|nr:ankyrin repeat domain-containing protein [Synergistaceae bacterium DZ-S4]